MLYYDRINISDGTDPTKSNKCKDCMIFHYWIFNHGFKFQNSVCNVCHNLTVLSVDIRDIVTIENVDYCYINYNISKSEPINLLKNCVLEDSGYT